MKRILTTLALAATISFTTMAQVNPNDKEYLHPREDGKIELLFTGDFCHHDTTTLAQLLDEWEKFTYKHPTNEIGWRNYSEVMQSYYMNLGWPEKSRQHREERYKRMAESIPNTYTYYFMNSGIDGYENACKAMELLPDDMAYSDMLHLIGIMMNREDTVRMTKLLTESYYRGFCPGYKLQYHFNELQGMPENALIIGTGGMGLIFPKLVIQYVLGQHCDKVIYQEGRSFDETYVEQFCQRFGIPKFDFKKWYRSRKPEPENVLAQYETHKKVVQHICDNSPRPVCFSSMGMSNFFLTDSLKARLYNEGLTLRYSATPYDNFAVKRRNIDQRYLFEYLLYPFEAEPKWNRHWRWSEDDKWFLAENYIKLLKDQLPWYKKHNRKGYEQLGNLFYRMSINSAIPLFRKAVKDISVQLKPNLTEKEFEEKMKEAEKQFEEKMKEYENWGFEKFLEELEAAEKKAKEADKNAETPTKQEKK